MLFLGIMEISYNFGGFHVFSNMKECFMENPVENPCNDVFPLACLRTRLGKVTSSHHVHSKDMPSTEVLTVPHIAEICQAHPSGL